MYAGKVLKHMDVTRERGLKALPKYDDFPTKLRDVTVGQG